jgi:bifunctional DNase/RNase
MERLRQFVFVCSLTLICAPAAALGSEAGGASGSKTDWVQVEKVEVRWSVVGPVVLLGVFNRAVPVFVDPTVAESIHSVLSGQPTQRPLTHELMQRMLQSLDAKVTRVYVTLQANTYYGDLRISVRGEEKVYDSRSSDAIALAIHFKAPIFLPKALVESNGVEMEGGGSAT